MPKRSQTSRSSLPVSHQQELMARMKLHDPCASQSFFQKVHPAAVRKNLRYEILSKAWIVQATFFFNGQIGKAAHEARGKQPAAVTIQKAGVLVHLYAHQTATG